MMKKTGLYIDVDTMRGHRSGGALLLSKKLCMQAFFVFNVGAWNLIRHFRQLAKDPFLRKMLRPHALLQFGWDAVLTVNPCPDKRIGAVNSLSICLNE